MGKFLYITLMEAFHKEVLGIVYDRLPSIFEASVMGMKKDFKKKFNPVVVGGTAYNKYMEAAGRGDQALFSDDIDVKIVIKNNQEELNSLPKHDSLRRCIKYFRASVLLLTKTFVTAYLEDAKNRGRLRGYNVLIRCSYENEESLLKSIGAPIRPLELCCLTASYQDNSGKEHHYGLMDTSFIMREHNGDPCGWTIKQFDSGLRMRRGVREPIDFTSKGIQATHIIPENTQAPYLCAFDFIMMDTVRMLSKAQTFEDVNISNPSQYSDVYKFDKYVAKFLQLCQVQGISALTQEECLRIYNTVASKKSVKEKLKALLDEDAVAQVYNHYIQYLPVPSSGFMDVSSGGRGGKRKKGGSSLSRGISIEDSSVSPQRSRSKSMSSSPSACKRTAYQHVDELLMNEAGTIHIEGREEVDFVPESLF